MSDRIKNIFRNNKAFIPFLTAGDPDEESTVSFILAMDRAGADMIEIGIPFSDPVAEGEVIQEADIRALQGGMTTDGVFRIAAKVREHSRIPLLFMTYLNPVFHYGYDRFFAKCRETGIDGIIIPDLPFEEQREVKEPAAAHDITLISMIAPTSEDRIARIASQAEGFLYVVSSMGVTGVRSEISSDLSSIMNTIRKSTDTPCAVGFGISTQEQAERMAQIADGCIVGSAVVKIIAKYGAQAGPYLEEYVAKIKRACMSAEAHG